MQILVNHLTRMQSGTICFAGIDLRSWRHIRPVVGHPLPASLLAERGGPLALGQLVDLGETKFCGKVPEIEDRHFQPEGMKVIRSAPPEELYSACSKTAVSRLTDVFGPDLKIYRRLGSDSATALIDEQCGIRSLGCYWAQQANLKIVDAGGSKKVRMEFVDEGNSFSVAVTDVRCFQQDFQTPDEVAIAKFQTQMEANPRTLVAIGLSRAHKYREEDTPQHWLQVNNIFPSQSLGA
jgi:hypothetical protein